VAEPFAFARIIHEDFYCKPPIRKSELIAVFFFRARIIQRTLDLASAVATTWTRTGSPLRRSTYCFKDAFLPRGLGPEACLAHSYKGAGPLVESPRRGHTPFVTSKRGVTLPHGSARPSRMASQRFRQEPS